MTNPSYECISCGGMHESEEVITLQGPFYVAGKCTAVPRYLVKKELVVVDGVETVREEYSDGTSRLVG